MRIAFYAPMKPPDHPVPSGDRQMARMLMRALRLAGHEVSLASRLRSYDASGDARRQERLRRRGQRTAQRLVARYLEHPAGAPELWFTYHLYHRAPDWIGPPVSAALRIPYVVAEASVAGKQRRGPWSAGFDAAAEAIRAAAAVIAVNPVDAEGVAPLRAGRSLPERLAPFVDAAALAAAGARPLAAAALARLRLPRGSPRLIVVAMMRTRAKLASYRLLGDALGRLVDLPWHLVVVGDGPARAEAAEALAGLGRGRVRMVGAQGPAPLAALLRSADLFVWPAIDEAFGMAFLEAQACGVPVVAGRSPGVAEVVADARAGTLARYGDAAAFAAAVRALLLDPERRESMGRAAARIVRARHDLPVAAARLDSILHRALEAARS